LGPIFGRFWADFGANFKLILGPILQRVTGAQGSHEGLKQHKVKKATVLPPFFEIGKK
jgi:hypothetical protein